MIAHIPLRSGIATGEMNAEDLDIGGYKFTKTIFALDFCKFTVNINAQMRLRPIIFYQYPLPMFNAPILRLVEPSLVTRFENVISTSTHFATSRAFSCDAFRKCDVYEQRLAFVCNNGAVKIWGLPQELSWIRMRLHILEAVGRAADSPTFLGNLHIYTKGAHRAYQAAAQPHTSYNDLSAHVSKIGQP